MYSAVLSLDTRTVFDYIHSQVFLADAFDYSLAHFHSVPVFARADIAIVAAADIAAGYSADYFVADSRLDRYFAERAEERLRLSLQNLSVLRFHSAHVYRF